MKRLAALMYLEGLGFSSIGRILNVSDVAVFKWIRSLGEKVASLSPEKPTSVEVMELDEMWHYVQKKLKNAGSGFLMIETERSLLPLNVVVVERRPENASGTD